MLSLLAACAWAGPPAFAAEASAAGGWTTTAAIAVQGAYDDNVFLQESGPLAGRGSFITTLQPLISGRFQSSDAMEAQLSYAPDVVFYRDEPGENFTTHRLTHLISGRGGAFRWDESGSAVLTAGPNESLVYAEPGGAPAIGGYPTRDRRDAFVLREMIKATLTADHWLMRATASFYRHDFQSRQRNVAGYQNHVDRGDWSAGADIGRAFAAEWSAFVGFRHGRQFQDRLFATGPAYGNSYTRVLASVEGTLFPGLKATALAGPSFHHFGSLAPEGFRARARHGSPT